MTNKLNSNTVGYASDLEDGIGCLRVRNLDMQQTPMIMRQLLMDLGEIRGLVLDLRDTYGDNFTHAVNTVPLLMESGEIWRTEQKFKNGLATSVITLTPDKLQWQGSHPPSPTRSCEWPRQPLLLGKEVVTIALINGDTRTAAGVIALALKNSRSAALWGTKTVLHAAPGRYFVVNNGNILRLTQSREKLTTGEWHDNEVTSNVDCEPHGEWPTDSFDEKLIAQAKAEILKTLAARRQRSRDAKAS